MKYRLSSLFLVGLAAGLLGGPLIVPVHAVPAFSGAEGWGAIATGGRGGAVLHVTNLDNSGPGSFRVACETNGPRTVVFDISGIIQLTNELSISNAFLTIAGQTAPGDGVIVAGETVSLDTSNLIVRYMRFRRGETNYSRSDDALGSDKTPGNIVIDHVSASWGLDENMSIYRWKNAAGNVLPTHNVTIQWSVSSEALNPFNHAFGATWGGKGVNYHHNLFACNTGRNPSISWSHLIDFRNSVLFNWQHRTIDGAGEEAHVNIINSYYKPGPATQTNELQYRIVKPEVRSGVAGPGKAGWWYVDGNYVVSNSVVTASNWNGGVQFDVPGMLPEYARTNTPHLSLSIPLDPRDPYDQDVPLLPTIATQSAEDAYQAVLAGAGATLPVRDAVDTRVVNMVATGIATAGPATNGIINHPSDVGGYPTITFVTRPPSWDTDQDGMPDYWEIEHGLDPNNAADRNDDFDHDGYTDLEEYLNELGAFKAVQDIVWDGETNNRYAQIENWDIAFQPSRFDTAVISNAAVVVDAIGQHAGILRLTTDANLNITNGWLKIADRLEIGPGCTAVVKQSGSLEVATNLVNDGTMRLTGPASLNVGGSFTNNGLVDIMTWSGVLPAGFVNHGTVLDRSAIRVVSAGVNAPDFEVTIQGYTGHSYQLQYCDDLTSGTWASIGSSVAGADAPITLTHPDGATAEKRFYRVAVD